MVKFGKELTTQIIMKKYILSIILIASYLTSTGQITRCFTDEHQAALDALNPHLAADRITGDDAIRQQLLNNPDYRVGALVTIPVVFHIIYNNSSQNIPDARIYEQLNVLNKDFGRTNADAVNTRPMFQSVAANTQIQFCLAQRTPQGAATNGILRIQSSNSTLPSNPHTISPEWDRTKYLNIYVGNLSGGLLGYANLPPGSAGNDHVVILFSSVGGPNAPGTLNPYHLGRTVTHEVGHWLNLQHTFNSGCSGLNNNNCMNAGDFICDTPPLSSSTFGCPSNTPNTCTETSPFPSPYTSDMVNQYENYMDYSDDGCMNMFTSGQAARMNAAINQYRLGLTTSNGCTPVGLEEILHGSFLNIFPNPSKGSFDLQFLFPVNTDVEITISDMKGEQVFKGQYQKSFNESATVDLSHCSAGVYQLFLKTKSGYLVKRLAIMR
jgi:hypothetical protein